MNGDWLVVVVTDRVMTVRCNTQPAAEDLVLKLSSFGGTVFKVHDPKRSDPL